MGELSKEIAQRITTSAWDLFVLMQFLHTFINEMTLNDFVYIIGSKNSWDIWNIFL